MIIKIDVDGVIRDIVSKMCEIYNEEFATNEEEKIYPCNIINYDVNKSFPLIYDKLLVKPSDYFFLYRGKDVFENSNVFDEVGKAIHSLRLKNHKVVIVTWQFNENNMKSTIDFFNRNDLFYDDICFTKDKWMINGDYLIDDNPMFILDEKDKAKKIIIDRPYNQLEECNNIKRCYSLMDAVNLILEQNK